MAMSQKEKTTYKQNFNEKNYDRLYISVPKGRKDVYKAKAEAAGKSLNQYIIDCIEGKE